MTTSRRQLSANNASTTLASDISSSDIVITVRDASRFPSPVTNEFFLITIDNGVNVEIVEVTSRVGNSLTGIIRAQEGTSASYFSAGSKVEVRVTAGYLSSIEDLKARVQDLSGTNPALENVSRLVFSDIPGASTARGLAWNNTEQTLDITLGSTGVVLQTGQEVLYRVRNNSGQLLPNGTVVVAAGTIGNSGRILVGPGVANGTIDGKYFMGVVTEPIPNGADGFVTHFGKVRGVPTDGASVGEAWADGDILYAHPSLPGRLTKNRPTIDNQIVTVAIVLNAHPTNGTLVVRPTIDSVDATVVRYHTAGGQSKTVQAAIDEVSGGVSAVALASSTGASLVGYHSGTVLEELDLLTGPSGAASVGYTPAGTGAVATTVQSKLRETVSITDKGDSLSVAFAALGGSEGTGYGASPVVLDLAGKTISFTGTLYVPINVSIVNGSLTSTSGKLVWRNPYLANTGLRGYTEYLQYMTSRNRDVVFNCQVVINVFIGAKFRNCDFNGLVLVNSNSLWTEYNAFDRCTFTQNTTIGAAIRFDGNKSGTSTYSTGTGVGTSDGSFGYNNFESNCKIDSTAPQVGISVVDGGTLYNAHLGFQGYARGAGPSGGFLYIDSSVNTSSVNQCVFEVHLESFGDAANVLSISNGSHFWYNTGSIQSASPEMVMSQDGTADLRANSIDVVGVVLLDSGGNIVLNGPSYVTKLVSNASRRQWTSPAFAVYTTSDQSFSSNTNTLITLGTEEYDTNNNFASSRFTPTVAGYYQINAQVRYTATGTVANAALYLYKNGSQYRASADVQALATTMVRTISTLVYMNGSTDYLEMIAYVFDNGGPPVIKGGAANTFFNGCLLIPA